MNDDQLLRYSRQIMLPQVDVTGQQKLFDSAVLIIGMGGLGSPVAMYLAAAGVGHIVIADYDHVEISNLQRQIIHNESSLGQSKVDSAKHALESLNSEIKVTSIGEKLTKESLAQWLNTVDCVVDGTDNFAARFAINEVCVKSKYRVLRFVLKVK